MYKVWVALSMLLLIGCGSRTDLAPVIELTWQQQTINLHIVRPGETLHAIAFRYDIDYKQLALLNHLQKPYALRVGQRLNLNKPLESNKRVSSTQTISPVAKKNISEKNSSIKKTILAVKPLPMRQEKWLWPAKGRIISYFIPQLGKKGIDIAGKKGDKIHAAANGVVAYAGSGLAGYGNLIIIKHDKQLLSAYGNNKRNQVSEGQLVKAGQIIAEMGVVDRRFWGMHFEIRKAGKPLDPLLYLPKN